MALALAHRIDHEIIHIHETDDAWDHEGRLAYELGVLEGKHAADPDRPVPWKSRSEHPWVRFVSGEARGDIRTAEEYLKVKDGPNGPVRFHFTRMSRARWRTYKGLKDQGLTYEAQSFALSCSLVAVDGAHAMHFTGGKKGKPLSESDLDSLRQTFGDDILEDLMILAVAFSKELTDPEKKS